MKIHFGDDIPRAARLDRSGLTCRLELDTGQNEVLRFGLGPDPAASLRSLIDSLSALVPEVEAAQEWEEIAA